MPFADLEDMLAASDPVTWAEENLEAVGAGDTSRVYAHPTNPGWVVRVGDYPDGFYSYAEWAAEFAEEEGVSEVAAHVPGLLDAAFTGDGEGEFYIGVCERLEPLREGDERLVDAARRFAQARGAPCIDSGGRSLFSAHVAAELVRMVNDGVLAVDEARMLDREQPGLLRLLCQLPSACSDIKVENWLRRGDALVLNDPQRGMSRFQEEAFRARHRVEAGLRGGLRS